MSKRRQLARERLEYYLIYLILAYRRLILIVGLILLVFAIANIFLNRIAGFALLLPAILLLPVEQFLQCCRLHRSPGSMDRNTWRYDD